MHFNGCIFGFLEFPLSTKAIVSRVVFIKFLVFICDSTSALRLPAIRDVSENANKCPTGV